MENLGTFRPRLDAVQHLARVRGSNSRIRPGSAALPRLQLKDISRGLGPVRAGRTLVVYLYSETEPEAENNLRYFLRWGVGGAGDGCEYVIVAKAGGTDDKELEEIVEASPGAVRVERHSVECYDWGTIGWLMDTRRIETKPFRYFIFMNSAVRGPFIPPYLQGRLRWQDLLLSRLTEQTKLVGPTISCESSPKGGDVNGEWRTNPHVQSVFAMDKVGLQTMLDDGNVFKCHKDMWDAIYYSELGSSLAILKSGFNLDSLMARYQGVDWSDEHNWGCNSRVNPQGEGYYDGISLDPLEVMFVKFKRVLVQNKWANVIQAGKYHEWLTEQDTRLQDVTSNRWKSEGWAIKAPKYVYMQARGPTCFDHAFYRARNQDLQNLTDDAALWEHWLTLGEFEGRPHRWTCEMTWQD
ncbi:hypothetical protein WJX84_002458 [Apatococcus fuscideae]|uniref:Uncharacterized protein n=1 Tax=Apatococcus fuscideae TaxID=2026836 RepID=A0AAW1SMZ1_9CHLO